MLINFELVGDDRLGRVLVATRADGKTHSVKVGKRFKFWRLLFARWKCESFLALLIPINMPDTIEPKAAFDWIRASALGLISAAPVVATQVNPWVAVSTTLLGFLMAFFGKKSDAAK